MSGTKELTRVKLQNYQYFVSLRKWKPIILYLGTLIWCFVFAIEIFWFYSVILQLGVWQLVLYWFFMIFNCYRFHFSLFLFFFSIILIMFIFIWNICNSRPINVLLTRESNMNTKMLRLIFVDFYLFEVEFKIFIYFISMNLILMPWLHVHKSLFGDQKHEHSLFMGMN